MKLKDTHANPIQKSNDADVKQDDILLNVIDEDKAKKDNKVHEEAETEEKVLL